MQEMTREEWLKARKEGIGASDAAAVCGESPWQTALEVYLDKTSQLTPEDLEKKPWLNLGLKLEPVIASLYSERENVELAIPEALQKFKDKPFIMANPDRTRVDDGRNVQCKSSGFKDPEVWGEDGSADVPGYYEVQVQHEMIVCGANMTDLAVLFGGRAFCIYQIPFNKAMAEEIIQIEEEFWVNHVVKGIPPDPDFSHDSTLNLIRKMYGVEEGKVIELGEAAGIMVSDYKTAAEEMKEAKKKQDEAKARLLSLMGEASMATIEGGPTLTRKMVQRKGYEVKPTEYMGFSIKKGAK